MAHRLEEVAKLDDSVNVDMEPEEALKLLLEDGPSEDSTSQDDAEDGGTAKTA
jgi:hypothetical protein